jgi:putative lipoprotein
MKGRIVILLIVFPILLFAQKMDKREHAFDLTDKLEIVNEDNWFSIDKARHIVASFLLAGGTSWVAKYKCDLDEKKSVLLGVTFTFSLGVGKELWDSRDPRNRFSWVDIVADLVGSFLGVLCISWW